jgi:hypothetical protein
LTEKQNPETSRLGRQRALSLREIPFPPEKASEVGLDVMMTAYGLEDNQVIRGTPGCDLGVPERRRCLGYTESPA